MQVPLDGQREYTFEDPSVRSPEERLRLFGQDDHVRVYGRDYGDRLAAAGFAIDRDGLAGSLDAVELSRTRVDPAEELWICERPA